MAFIIAYKNIMQRRDNAKIQLYKRQTFMLRRRSLLNRNEVIF